MDCPVSGSFSPFNFSVGLIGKLNLNSFSFLPFVSYLQSAGKSRYLVDAAYTNITTSERFIRSYVLTEKVKSAYMIGLETRYNFENPLYLGLKSSFSSYQVSGESVFYDLDEDNNRHYSESENYSRLVNVLSFELIVGIRFGAIWK